MGRLIVTEFVTVDGVAQAPGQPDEDRTGGFTHGGWQGPLFAPDVGEAMFDQAKSMDALLLGRRTFETFAAYWPTAPAEIPFTALLNGVAKYVATRTLAEPLAWEGSTPLTGDLTDDVAALKARHEEVHVIGSLDLVQSLLRLGLIDRLNLWVHPLLLGTGKRVFSGGTVPENLRLTASATYSNGVVRLDYDPIGEPEYGNLAA